METQANFYEVTLRLQSERFDVQTLDEYHLILSVGRDAFKVCILDTNTHEIMLIEDYVFYGSPSMTEVLSVFNSIYDAHLFLKANFWKKISVIIRDEPFTLIPNEFFEEDQLGKYLRWISPIPTTHFVYTCEQPTIDAKDVFLINQELLEWLQNVAYAQKKVHFYHQSATFIEGIMNQHHLGQPLQVHIQVEKSYLLVVVKRNKVLEFCNMFHYKTAQDFIYFILLTLDELRLDPQNCQILLYGNIKQQSSIFDLLYRYTKNVQFAKEPIKNLQIGQNLEKLPHYQYFDILSAHYLL